MSQEIFYELLKLLPTVAVTAVIVERLVQLGKELRYVGPNDAPYANLLFNGIFYVALFAAGQLGYETQVNEGVSFVNAHINEVIAGLGLLFMVLSSTGAAKLVHEGVKLLQKNRAEG